MFALVWVVKEIGCLLNLSGKYYTPFCEASMWGFWGFPFMCRIQSFCFTWLMENRMWGLRQHRKTGASWNTRMDMSVNSQMVSQEKRDKWWKENKQGEASYFSKSCTEVSNYIQSETCNLCWTTHWHTFTIIYTHTHRCGDLTSVVHLSNSQIKGLEQNNVPCLCCC